MDNQNLKCVMVIDESLPTGIISNTAAVMGITLGKLMPEAVGSDVTDCTGTQHPGIIEVPVPILKGTRSQLRELRSRLYHPDYADMAVVDFSDVAQSCKTYDEFIDKIAAVPESELQYFGVAICGNKKQVNRLTGSMALLR
jgi:hypothetical protein